MVKKRFYINWFQNVGHLHNALEFYYSCLIIGFFAIAFSFCSPDENAYIRIIENLIEKTIKIIHDHPYPISEPTHKKKQPNTISKHKKGRKSVASKKKKKRWY